MSRIRLDQDIQPLSEFRAGVTSFIRQINETHRPLVITQRGKGVAVRNTCVIDVFSPKILRFILNLMIHR